MIDSYIKELEAVKLELSESGRLREIEKKYIEQLTALGIYSQATWLPFAQILNVKRLHVAGFKKIPLAEEYVVKQARESFIKAAPSG
jgi:hypothetical protein